MPEQTPLRRPSSVRLVLALTACAAAVLVGTTALAAPPASAAGGGPGAARPSVTLPSSAGLTASVDYIAHGLQQVGLVGTGPVGGSISVAAAGVDTVWTEVGRDGTWSAVVKVPTGEHTLVVTSQVTGESVEVPVVVDNALFPQPGHTVVDPLRGTVDLDLSFQKPGARWDFAVDGRAVGSATVDPEGVVRFRFEGVRPGDHTLEGVQFYDNHQNGGWNTALTVDGSPRVTSATASRETDRLVIVGRGVVDTELTFADAEGDLTDDAGEVARIRVGGDTRWRVELPIPPDATEVPVTITAWEPGTSEPVGRTGTVVDVPASLTATVEQLPDGSLRLAGSGAEGAVVSLEDDGGRPVRDAAGRPVRATVTARAWSLTAAREVLPPDAVVARQRLDGVEQGSLRLVLPALPVRPQPGGNPDVSAGNHPAAAHATGSRVTERATTRLAYTGTDPSGPLGAAAVLLAAGAAVLLGQRSRSRSRRRLHRGGR